MTLRTSTDDEDSARSVELAHWLVEAGRRKPLRRESIRCAVPAASGAPDLRRVTLLAVLGLASVQYWYLDTLLEITSLQSLIVFVLARTAG